MKNKFTASLLLIAVLAVLIIGSFARARAGQYDVAYPIRISGTGPLLLNYVGTSGTWLTVATTSTNGVVQTTGTGLAVNATPIISSTAAIAAAGQTPTPGQLATSSSGTLLIYGTNSAWRAVP